MVRKYVRKTDRQKWEVENMESAVQAVINKGMGLKKASVQFSVPKTTLRRYKEQREQDQLAKIDKTKGKFQCVFSSEQELELVDYLKTMESRLFGLTMQDFRSVAFQLAERNHLNHPFNKDKKIAGKDWMKNFLARHQDLSIRKPEATSGARAMGFNRPNVTRFFDLLAEVVDKYRITADRLYNCDETGITVNPKGHSKIIAARGKRQVGVLTSAERGETVTAELCYSAAGIYMPPMLIFPRKRMQKEFELGLPPGSWAEAHETGWMTTEIFTRWFRKFVRFSKASKENVVLLLFDGHATHTKNIEVIDLARENGVVLLCLPPHASHRLQPLDVSLMKPLSSYYEDETRKWLRLNPGKVITLWQIASLFGSAFINAATMRTAMKGFEKTGIWPVNMGVFTDADFLPSAPTDIEITLSAQVPVEATSASTPSTSNSVQSSDFTPVSTENAPAAESFQKDTDLGNVEDEIRPSCYWNTEIIIKSPVSSSFPHASPVQVMAVPKATSKEKRKTNRKKGKAEILTASPYKNELQQSLEEASRKKEEKERKAVTKKLKLDAKGKTVFSGKGKSVVQKRKTSNRKVQEEDSDVSDTSDAECLYCNDFYSTSTEGWIACGKCHRWAHNSCANIDSDDDEAVHICQSCHD